MATYDFINTRQIVKYQTGRALVEFNDKLSIADPEKASNLHSNFSKIKIVANNYENGSIITEANINPDTMKLLATMILSGEKIEYSEQKINPYSKNEKGEAKVNSFSIKFNEKMRYPWNIVVENGYAIPEKQPTGGTATKKGTYRKDKEVKIFIDDMSIKKMMLTIKDYIAVFEADAFSKLMPKRTELEEKIREERNNQAS